jgi:hypothetical protein
MAGLSPKSPTVYTGPKVFLVPTVTRNRQPTGADFRQPETGKLYPVSTIWQVGPNPTDGTEGEMYILTMIVANVAYWQLIGSGSSGPLIDIEVDETTGTGVQPVSPTGAGLITFNGAAAAQRAVPVETITNAPHQMEVSVQYATASASPGNADLNGISNYDEAVFTVSDIGFVGLVGGSSPAVQEFTVQAGSPTSITADSSGNVNVSGAVVSQTGVPVQTYGTGAHSYQTNVQYSTSAASTSTTIAGLSSFNSNNFTVDANGFVSSVSPKTGFTNLGITYSAGTGLFSVTAANGSALSSTNVATVTIFSALTPGTTVTIPITANQTFTDHNGSSTISGNTFGLTSSVAYTQDVPFIIYAILNTAETAINFAIGRLQYVFNTPTSGFLAKTGSAVATTEKGMFLFGNPTVSNYASQPCLRIGWMRMQMTSGNDWTVQTLSDIDGMNENWKLQTFNVPLGTFGAASGTYFLANGGTAPIFAATNAYVYHLTDYEVVCYVGMNDMSSTGTAGSGNVTSQLACPFAFTDSNRPAGSAYGVTGSYNAGLLVEEQLSSNFVILQKMSDLTTVLNSNWTASGKNFRASFRSQAAFI